MAQKKIEMVSLLIGDATLKNGGKPKITVIVSLKGVFTQKRKGILI